MSLTLCVINLLTFNFCFFYHPLIKLQLFFFFHSSSRWVFLKIKQMDLEKDKVYVVMASFNSRKYISKKQGMLFLARTKTCGMPIAGEGLKLPKSDRFRTMFALLDFKNWILQIAISTTSMHQKIREAPTSYKIISFIL